MSETILVVDDDEGQLEFCEATLTLAGYQVKTAETGDRALKQLDAATFDLVLTDLMLPGKTDGHGVVMAVKSHYPTTEVIVMTAAPTLKTAIATLRDGAYDYVIKPLDSDAMIAAVRRCLDHRRLKADLEGERTLRRELETAYQELQKVERLKEAFLARASHELNTPMAELGIAIQLLAASAANWPEGEGRKCAEKYVDMALQGIAQLRKTLEDVLVFVDLQKRGAMGKLEPVDVEALCWEIVEQMRTLWEPRRLTVSVAFQAGAPPVLGNRDLLAKAFRHLVHNAVVFNREGGKVEVKGSFLPKHLRVAFSDTGEGIPESELHKIFDSFYQVADYLTRKVGGMGLGLAITRRIVEAHGGEITVSSRHGEGTTFTVFLPKTEA